MTAIHQREPVVTAGVVSALVIAAAAVLVAFGIHVSKEQTAALVGLVGALAPIAAALVARRKVTPVSKAP